MTPEAEAAADKELKLIITVVNRLCRNAEADKLLVLRRQFAHMDHSSQGGPPLCVLMSFDRDRAVIIYWPRHHPSRARRKEFATQAGVLPRD